MIRLVRYSSVLSRKWVSVISQIMKKNEKILGLHIKPISLYLHSCRKPLSNQKYLSKLDKIIAESELTKLGKLAKKLNFPLSIYLEYENTSYVLISPKSINF